MGSAGSDGSGANSGRLGTLAGRDWSKKLPGNHPPYRSTHSPSSSSLCSPAPTIVITTSINIHHHPPYRTHSQNRHHHCPHHQYRCSGSNTWWTLESIECIKVGSDLGKKFGSNQEERWAIRWIRGNPWRRDECPISCQDHQAPL